MLAATRVRAAHHEPDDVPEPPGGGGTAEPAPGALLLGVCAPLPAPHPTLPLPGTASPQFVCYTCNFNLELFGD